MNKNLRVPILAVILLLSYALYSIIDIILLLSYGNELVFAYYLWPILDLLLSGVLIFKRNDNVLVITVACFCLFALIFSDIWWILAYLIFLLIVVSFSEQTLLKFEMTKLRSICSKAFMAPFVLISLRWIFFSIRYGEISIIIQYIVNLGIIKPIAILCVCMWLKNPSKKEKVKVENNEKENVLVEGYCGLGKHILLLLFTFGIWYLIWIYRTTRYLNRAPKSIYYAPASKLLLCLFVPFYAIYWFYKHGQRIDLISKSKGMNKSDTATLCLILGIFIPFVACIIMQDKINELCLDLGVKTENSEEQKFNALKKYKDLLESDIITQEEFDKKKKELLDL